MGDTNSGNRVFPKAAHVYRVSTPVVIEHAGLAPANGFFTFYATSLVGLSDSVEAQGVFVPDVVQSSRFHFVMTFRRPQGKVRFKPDTPGLIVLEVPLFPWMSVDEAQALAELEEMSNSPYATETSEFIRRIQEHYTKSVVSSSPQG